MNLKFKTVNFLSLSKYSSSNFISSNFIFLLKYHKRAYNLNNYFK